MSGRMQRRLRAVAIVVLLLAALAFATVGGLRVERRFRETRFVGARWECPLVVDRREIWPECPAWWSWSDGS